MPNILLVVATIATLTAAQNLTTGCVGSSLYGYYGANCTEGTPASQTQNITSELSGVYSFLGGYTCTNKTVSSYSKIKNCSACFDGTFNTTFSYRPTSDSYNLTIAGFPSPYTNGSTTCNCMYGSTGPQNLTTSGSGAFITYSNSTVRVDYAASQSPLGSMAYGTIIPSYGGNGGCSYIFNPLAPFNGTLACIFNTRDDLECTGNVSYISYSRYGNPGSCWKGGDGASCYPRNYYTFVPYYPPSTETVYTGSPTGTATANSTATTSSQIGNTPTLSSTRTGTSSSAKPTTTSGGFIMLAPAKLFITLLVVAGVAVFLV